jgi:hypothetical protein
MTTEKRIRDGVELVISDAHGRVARYIKRDSRFSLVRVAAGRKNEILAMHGRISCACREIEASGGQVLLLKDGWRVEIDKDTINGNK